LRPAGTGLGFHVSIAHEADHVLAEAVDMRPANIANAVAVAGDVDHVGALRLRRRHVVMALLVGDDHEAVDGKTVHVRHRAAEIRALMRLAAHDRVDASHAAPRRHFDDAVREREHPHHRP
jgi:hypothetical protein